MFSTMWTDFGFFILTLFLQRSIYVSSVEIRKLSIPGPIENGSEPFVILDCDYTYEQKDVATLVVKWYLNNGRGLVYQWIPPHPPQALGVLANRLDLEYRATDDNYTMHRSLKILRPTLELAGEYKCHVESFETEDRKTGQLRVYE